MDARKRYTLNIIKQSLLSLLKEKPIEEITVSEICSRAEINRTTFYRSYDNQYALLESLQDEILEEIKEAVTKQNPNPDELYLLMLSLIYENRGEWLILMGSNADPRISRKITHFISDYFNVSDKSEAGKMKYRYILSGSAGLLEYWIRTGMKESPECMAGYLNAYSHALTNITPWEMKL